MLEILAAWIRRVRTEIEALPGVAEVAPSLEDPTAGFRPSSCGAFAAWGNRIERKRLDRGDVAPVTGRPDDAVRPCA